jgi:hypothetical protein
VPRTAADVNGYFLGGYGSVLRQLFGRNFPNYAVGVSLNIPIRNRAAQADYVTDQLNFRQQLIQEKQLHNSIRQGVINTQITLQQSRSALDTSIEARRLQEQTQAGTRRKYELGTATILDVVITQRDSTNRQLAEVQARSNYIHSRINMDSVLGRVLDAMASTSTGEERHGRASGGRSPLRPPRQRRSGGNKRGQAASPASPGILSIWLASILSNRSDTLKKPARSGTSSPNRTTRSPRRCRRGTSRSARTTSCG